MKCQLAIGLYKEAIELLDDETSLQSLDECIILGKVLCMLDDALYDGGGEKEVVCRHHHIFDTCHRMVEPSPAWYFSGLVTKTIIFADFSRIDVKGVRFQQTHNQGLCQFLLTVSWDLCG